MSARPSPTTTATPFDAWRATELEALQAQDRCGDLVGSAHDPRVRWTAARLVEARAPGATDSDLLGLVGLCFQHDLTAPQWLTQRFVNAIGRVTRGELLSWDECFSRPWPKGTRRAKVARDQRLMPLIVARAHELCIGCRRPVDVGLFEQIGAEQAISASVARDLYYAALRKGLAGVAEARREARGNSGNSRNTRKDTPRVAGR